MGPASLLFGLMLAAPPPMHEHVAEIMTTKLVLRIVLKHEDDRPKAEAAAKAVEAELRRIEALLSEWKPGSPFAKINEAPTRWHTLPEEAQAILQRALQWSERTEGAFDPTFASLWGLWRFHEDEASKIPTPAQAQDRAKLIDYRKVVLDGATVRMRAPGMKLGLGGIAKGYAVDRGVRLLRKRGFANFFIKLGGELYLAGRRPDRPWVTGVQDPRDARRHFAMVALENSAFTTSGDYQRYIMVDGVRYHHIIDPQTGYPARKCRSVTIVAKQAEDADALSTAVFVLGATRGLKLVHSLPGIEAIIVDAEGEVHISKGLQGKVRLTR